MKMIEYLTEAYGCCTPIILKDLRIGGKTKTAIRKELSRATAEGKICRMKNGVYYILEDTAIPRELSFRDVVEIKFIKNDYGFKGLDLDVYGYYSGQTFLHQLGLTQQVPAKLEIVTNKTSCKRIYACKGFKAIIRKCRCTIDRFNYKILQLFDALNFMSEDMFEDNIERITNYYKSIATKGDIEKYSAYFPHVVVDRLLKLEAFSEVTRRQSSI
jgi:hypothetical protein